VYNFLLVINSNLGFISHRYWDTATYLQKNRKFCPFTSHLAPSFGVTHLNLWKSFAVPETRVFQAADGEDLVIQSCTVFDWSTRVTDRRTDRQTDRQTELRWLKRTESSKNVTKTNRTTIYVSQNALLIFFLFAEYLMRTTPSSRLELCTGKAGLENFF